MDDQCVGIGHIQAVLHDGGGHQHINAAFHEPQHHIFQGVIGELRVAHTHAGIGHQGADMLGDADDTFHPVVHEIHLAAAAQLELDGGGDQFVGPGRNYRLDGEAILGRGFNERNLTQACEAHM